mgnify:CR=1 FL=1
MQRSLNDITAEDLAEINKLAAAFYVPKEIAMILELPTGLFMEACTTEGTECFNAFNGGRLKSEYEVRAAVVQLAKAGSSPAQTMAMQMINTSKMKMMDS